MAVKDNFLKLLKKYYQSSPEFTNQVEKARKWFRQAARQITGIKPEVIMDKKGPFKARLVPEKRFGPQHIGRMIMFVYDPKWKNDDKKLPYYDTLPVVLPISINKDNQSFLGLNLHYLPYNLRAKLMDAIYSLYKDKHLSEKKRIELSYEILTGAAKFRYFKPCLKMYLFNHVRSAFNVIHPDDWDTVMMLPIEQFHKKSKEEVWKESVNKIGG